MAFRTKCLRSTRQVLPKKLDLDKLSKSGFVGRGLRRMLLKILCAPTFRVLLEDYHQLDLDTCVRRLVTKNGEFEGHQ